MSTVPQAYRHPFGQHPAEDPVHEHHGDLRKRAYLQRRADYRLHSDSASPDPIGQARRAVRRGDRRNS